VSVPPLQKSEKVQEQYLWFLLCLLQLVTRRERIQLTRRLEVATRWRRARNVTVVEAVAIIQSKFL
jgi:hypothetical protein